MGEDVEREKADGRSSYILLSEELRRSFFPLLRIGTFFPLVDWDFFFSVAEGGGVGWMGELLFFVAESAVAVM
jgi:hypothetical protein